MTSSDDVIREYHERTSHRFEAYAAGPETLDWDAQPSPFRHFEGTQQVQLPAFSEVCETPVFLSRLNQPFSSLPAKNYAPLNLESISVLLHLALGITAWKTYGPDRWAVRANPSSGNLHPTEAYLFIAGVSGLSDGLYHYRVETHTLEHRADFFPHQSKPFINIALTSVMWREAWKYGERAFRYCQLDTGHAMAAMSYAAAVLGWGVYERTDITYQQLTHSLGLDREEDFIARRLKQTEQEEAEALLSIAIHNNGFDNVKIPNIAKWYGKASAIDKHPMYEWPVIDKVATATRTISPALIPRAVLPNSQQILNDQLNKTVGQVILGRRSAQRFDPSYIMSKQDFLNMMESLLPSSYTPWHVLSSAPCINLVIFIHRVEGLTPGLYLLPRVSRLSQILHDEMGAEFLFQPLEGSCLEFLLPVSSGALHRITRSLNCHQDIASTSCFSIGMLSEFNAVIEANPASYRQLFREAGLIGQVLYLQAESLGLRGTGIGCYFDHQVQELLMIKGDTFKSVYHFTVGFPIEDTRIETISTSNIKDIS